MAISFVVFENMSAMTIQVLCSRCYATKKDFESAGVQIQKSTLRKARFIASRLGRLPGYRRIKDCEHCTTD